MTPHTHTQPEDCPFAYPIDSFLVSLHFSSKGVFALLNCCRCCRFCSIWKFCFHLSVALQRTDATTAAAFYANDLSSAEGCSFDFDAAAAAAARKSRKSKVILSRFKRARALENGTYEAVREAVCSVWPLMMLMSHVSIV